MPVRLMLVLVPTSVAVKGSGDDLTAVPDERQQLSITVDRRTNALLVSGTPKYLDLVKNVVEQLDSLEANERETFTVQLRNAKATEVATIVTDFVEEEHASWWVPCRTNNWVRRPDCWSGRSPSKVTKRPTPFLCRPLRDIRAGPPTA